MPSANTRRLKALPTEQEVLSQMHDKLTACAAILHNIHENGFTSASIHSTGFGPGQRQEPMVYIAIPISGGINADMLAWVTEEYSDRNIQIHSGTGKGEMPFLMIWPDRDDA